MFFNCLRRTGLGLAASMLLGLAALALTAPEARAAEEVRSSDVYVTAGRVEQELLDVPMSVSVITEEDVRKSSAGTVGKLLEDVPGVQVINSGGQGFNRISIRGEGTTRTLILIDGQKIAENKSMDGTALLIDPSRIERVEVIRGPASVLYGSEAMGGVVNIITKKGGKEIVEGEASFGVNTNNNGYSLSGTVAGSYEGWSYRVSGSNADFGDQRSPEGRMKNTDYQQNAGSGFLSYAFAEKLTVGGGFEYFDGTMHAGSMQPNYERFRVDVPEWRLERYYAFAELKDLSDWMPRLRLDVFTQESHKLMHNFVPWQAAAGMPADTSNDANNYNDQFGLSLQADWQILDNHYLITGYEYNKDRLYADSYTAMDFVSPMIPDTYRDARHKGNQQFHAAFAQMESQLPAYFTLNYGMRYTWVRSKMDRAEAWGTMANLNVGSTGTESESRPVFNLGLMWGGIENMTLRATFSQGFRAPNLQERFVQTSMGGVTVTPNPDLDPETSNNYELGLRYAGENLSIDLAGFYSDADDYITSVRTGSTTARYDNVSSAKTHGVELGASYDLPYGFTPYVTGTWMQRKFDWGNRTTWKTGVPEWSARAGLRFFQTLNEDVDFWADAYGRFYSETKDEEYSNMANTYSTIKYDSWQTANLAAGFDFGEKRQYSISAELLNITDERYRFNDDIEEPGLHATMKFTVRF